jgi:hypothetical protein
MFQRILIGGILIGALAGGSTVRGFAQQPPTDASQDAKKAKEEAKKGAKDTGDATKDAAKATGKATESGAKKTGQVTSDAAKETATGTKKAATTVKKKVTPDTTEATCKDGSVQTGKTKTTACADHGGFVSK